MNLYLLEVDEFEFGFGEAFELYAWTYRNNVRTVSFSKGDNPILSVVATPEGVTALLQKFACLRLKNEVVDDRPQQE